MYVHDVYQHRSNNSIRNSVPEVKETFSNQDSAGNQLSEGQQEYFKDSKERDNQGRLRVMYRGDSTEVTVFDRKKSSYSNLYGRGFYFTNSASHAGQYGQATAYYLNITNPVSTTDCTITKKQFQNMSNQMDIIIYVVIGMGSVICIAAIYVAVNMLVTENRSNISMLKVLSIPLVFASNNWFMTFLADFIGAMPKAYIAPQRFVYTAVLICLSYFGSLALLRRKVSKVDMVESLKGNRA